MSDSMIPLAPPNYVKLTDNGVEYWAKWMSAFPSTTDDVFRMCVWEDHDHETLLERLHDGRSLWMLKKEVIAVRCDPSTGVWETVPDGE